MLPPALSPRVQVFSYDGGHAIYTDDTARRRLRADVAKFIGASAPGARSAASRAPAVATELAVTHHTITVHGRPMRYTARAGVLPIVNNDAGEVHGEEFFIAYTLDRPAGSPPRPVTFLWNGGPGANSVFVHLVGFGPQRISGETLDQNEETWLRATDLVFVDPIGTGFSRPAKAEFAAEFYSTNGDIASTAEFVRAYRTHFDLLKAPVYLAGESYGVWRAAGAAELLEKRGQRIAGVIMISGGVAMGPVVSGAYRAALLVPSRAATAFYHGKLSPELQKDLGATMQQARQWALTEYAPALARRDSLSAAESARIITQLARFSGVNPWSVDQKTLVITSPQFRALLLSDRKETLGRYDMRLVGQSGEPDHARLVTRYLREDLRYYTDLAYQGEEEGWSLLPPDSVFGVGDRWDWDQGNPPPGPPVIDPEAPPAATSIGGSGDGPPGGAQPWLRRAMKLDPVAARVRRGGTLRFAERMRRQRLHRGPRESRLREPDHDEVLRRGPHDVRRRVGAAAARERCGRVHRGDERRRTVMRRRQVGILGTMAMLGGSTLLTPRPMPAAPTHISIRADTDSIMVIRSRYARIQRDTLKYRRTKHEHASDVSEATAVLYGYFDGDSLRKLVAATTNPESMVRNRQEFFFWDGKLFFVFAVDERLTRGARSASDTTRMWKVAHRTEDRFYFAGGAIIRWVDSAGRIHPGHRAGRCARWGEGLLENARRYAACAAAKPSDASLCDDDAAE